MKKQLYLLSVGLLLSIVCLGQKQKLNVSGNVKADSLSANKYLQLGTSTTKGILRGNGTTVPVGSGLSLNNGVLSTSNVRPRTLLTYTYTKTGNNVIETAVNLTNLKNDLNLNISGNALSATNWVVGGIYEIVLQGKLNLNLANNNVNNTWVSFTTSNSVSTETSYGGGAVISLIRWNGNVPSSDNISSTDVGYFVPTAANQTLYLRAYFSNTSGNTINLKGSISIRKID